MKKFLKRFIITAVAAALCSTALAGFAGCDGKTLTVNTMFGGSDNHNTVYTSLNTKFKKDTGYKIIDRSKNPSDDANWGTDLITQVNGDNSPDIIFYFNTIESIKDNLVTKKEMLEYAGTSFAMNIKMNVFNADQYGIPIKAGSQAVMYNTNYLSADNFLTKESMLSALSAASVSAAVSADLPHYWLNHLLVYELGYTEYKAFDGKKTFFTDERKVLWAESLKNALNDMRSAGFYANADKGNGGQSAAFWNGDLSLSIDGQWTASSFEGASAKSSLAFANFPAPEGESGGFYIGGVTTGWYITKKGWENEKKRDAIIKYISMHTSDEALNSYCVAGGGTPANKKELTGAATAATGFAGVTYGKEQLIAIDDRMPSEAKTALMGDFTTGSGAPKLLAQSGDVTYAEALALLEAMIEKLS